jgi:uncharacterized ion transporter superfamily protein YfcC
VAILFIGGLEESSFGQYIAALFVLTMALMVLGLILFSWWKSASRAAP